MQKEVFASLFPEDGLKVFTIKNKDSVDKNGKQLKLSYEQVLNYFDIWNGKQLNPERDKDCFFFSFPLEGLRFGAVMASKPKYINNSFQRFLKIMNSWATKPLKSYPSTWDFMAQFILPINRIKQITEIPKGRE